MYRSRLGIASAAGVVPGVLERGPADCEPGLRTSSGLRLHCDPASGGVVVDHAVVVVPEHVLWGCWALEREKQLEM